MLCSQLTTADADVDLDVDVTCIHHVSETPALPLSQQLSKDMCMEHLCQ